MSNLAINTKIKREKELDKYLKATAQELLMTKYQISPSRNFREETMQKIIDDDRRRKKIYDICFGVFIFTPLLTKQIWLLIRHDYFSLAHWPMAEIFMKTYWIFLSNLTTYFLIGLSVLILAIYFWGSRRLISLFKSLIQNFSQIISFGRLRI